MPRFDFHCAKCSHVFEVDLPFGSAKKPACPSCTSKKVEKLLTPPGVVFKGSGFYKTDAQGGGTSTPKKEDAPAKETPVEKPKEAPAPKGEEKK